MQSNGGDLCKYWATEGKLRSMLGQDLASGMAAVWIQKLVEERCVTNVFES